MDIDSLVDLVRHNINQSVYGEVDTRIETLATAVDWLLDLVIKQNEKIDELARLIRDN